VAILHVLLPSSTPGATTAGSCQRVGLGGGASDRAHVRRAQQLLKSPVIPQQEVFMKAVTLAALALVMSVGTTRLSAQAPCATNRAVVDSARNDVFTILGSDGQLVTELRQEQGLSADSLSPVTVTDPAICTKLASAFNRLLPTTTTFAVLRVGSVYYVRDPDQKRATGVVTDSTFRVLMRLGAEIPPPRRP
jgi:hypothetical protein